MGTLRETPGARVFAFDEEVERYRRKVSREMTRGIVSFVIATVWAMRTKRTRR